MRWRWLLSTLMTAANALKPPVVCSHATLAVSDEAPAMLLYQNNPPSPNDRALPLPLPADALPALACALAPHDARMRTSVVRAAANHLRSRDGTLFDNLPWGGAGPLAKRDAAKRLDSATFSTPYAFLLAAIDGIGFEVEHVCIEDTDLLGSLVLGGTVLLRRRVGSASGQLLCESTVDEAVGVALCAGLCIEVERSVWERIAREPNDVESRRQPLDPFAPEPAVVASATAPWEISSLEELRALSLEAKARSALAAGLQPPRARAATDEGLTALLEPLLDEAVRRQLQIARAVDEEDFATAATLKAATSRRGRLMDAARAAFSAGRYAEAAEVALELRTESERRMDVTLDEGAYDKDLDQDEWYAQQLARERRRVLDAERGARATSQRTGRIDMTTAPPQSGGGGGVFRFPDEPKPAWAEWNSELAERVRVQVVAAMDHYPPAEAASLLDRLVDAAAASNERAERSLGKLVALTGQLESLERAAAPAPVGGSMSPELVADEARTLYSQVRMWTKDGELF